MTTIAVTLRKAGRSFAVAELHDDGSTVDVGDGGSGSFDHALARARKCSVTRGLPLRYAERLATGDHLTLIWRAGSWFPCRALAGGAGFVSTGDKIRTYDRFDAAANQLRLERKKTELPIVVDLDPTVGTS